MRLRLGLAGVLVAASLRADQTVTIGPGFAFSPATVTVAPGDTVTWTWQAGPHSTTSNATSAPEFWDSGIRFTGASFSHTFLTLGTYPYYCSVHSSPTGTAMNGVVIVAPPPTATPLPPTATPAQPTATPVAGPAAPVPALGAASRLALGIGFAAAALILMRRLSGN